MLPSASKYDLAVFLFYPANTIYTPVNNGFNFVTCHLDVFFYEKYLAKGLLLKIIKQN